MPCVVQRYRFPRMRAIPVLTLLLFCSWAFAGAAFGAPSAGGDPSSPEKSAPEIRPPAGFRDRSGFRELEFWQIVNGAVMGGMLATAVTADQVNKYCVNGEDQNNSSKCRDALARSGGIATLGLASGIALPYWFTRDKPVTTADAITINRAALLGAMHGFIIPFAAGLKPLTDEPGAKVNINNTRWLSGLTFAGDLAGISTGIYLTHTYAIDPGFASFAGTLHTTTFLAASSIGSSFYGKLTQNKNRVIAASSLAAADIALASALYHREEIDIGRNRVFWIDTGAMVGWIAGAGMGSIIGGANERTISIGATIGLAVGMYGTYISTKNTEDWRRRVDFSVGAIHFSAPEFSVRPMQNKHGDLEMAYSMNLYGSF